jgi:membrane peptidoglycan carboxypeptidase
MQFRDNPASLRLMRLVATSFICASLLGPAEGATRRKAAKRPALKPVEILAPAGASPGDLLAAQAAQAAIGRSRNIAVIAMDPWTGRVITVGNPDSGVFAAYQPCSVFKLVVAVAGLAEGAIQPETRYHCSRGCWISPGHGPIDLRRALAVSCNPYFEWLGERVGFDTVMAYADRMGLGRTTGLNIAGEAPGAIPAAPPRQGVGHMSSHGAGIKTSAIQLATLMSALVNGGHLLTPKFMSESEGATLHRVRDRDVPASFGSMAADARVAPRDVLLFLRPGLFSAVTEGSAQRAFFPDFIASGKTGSCSGVGWFASALGYPRAEMIVVTLVRGGNGSSASAAAGTFYRRFLGLQEPTIAIADSSAPQASADASERANELR